MNGAVLNYYEWLCEKVGLYTPAYNSYGKLIDILFNTEYVYSIPMDQSRELDGLDLRRRWRDETGVIGDVFDGKPCSVLEMLAALSLRVENEIMGDPQLMIFWQFLWNLDLQWADDRALRHVGGVHEVEDVLYEWMNGISGRNIVGEDDGSELWYQVMRYVSERYQDGWQL